MYSKAKLAAACAGIVYFLSYVPYMYVAIREEAAGDKIPAWAKSIAVRSVRVCACVCASEVINALRSLCKGCSLHPGTAISAFD